MASTPGTRASSLPLTFVGRWLRASMLGQRELRDQLVGTLNRGKPGWNDDEPAVVVACCELVLRRVWPDGPGQADIEWLSSLCEAAFADDRSPIGAADAEAVVRTAVREQDGRAANVPRGDTYRICGLVAAGLSMRNDFAEADVAELVQQAERTALERGWHPPLVDRRGSGEAQPGATRGTASAVSSEPIVSTEVRAVLKAAAAASVGVELPLYRDAENAVAEAREAIESGGPDEAAAAACRLGCLLQERGNVADAMAAFRLAIDSGHRDCAPSAALSLGILLSEEGDAAGAKDAYQQAIDSGHPGEAAAAAGCLGVLLQAQGDIEGAKAAYQLAADHPDELVALGAMDCLAAILRRQGDADGAKALYTRVLESGHDLHAPMAAGALAELLAQQGDADGAMAAYRQAIESGHALASPAAALNLGILLSTRGDLQGAESAYRKAIDASVGEVAARAAVNLGALLEQQGNINDARAAYRRVVGSDHETEDFARQRLRALRKSR